MTDFIDYTGQKRKNVDNLKSYPSKTYKNIYFFLISVMIVPKNHWFVIYSVDNFWLSEGEVLITQLLSHLLFINYFWGEE